MEAWQFRSPDMLASALEFIAGEVIRILLNKCSEFIDTFIRDPQDDDCSQLSDDMAEDENIWFDGVDKKLLEAHTRQKSDLVEASDRTLVTKTPLTAIIASSTKKKRKHSDLAATSSKTNSKKLSNGDATACIKPNTGITDEVALDCEMVECYHHKSVLARVSIVNLFGHPILDTYVAPPSKVTDYRTRYSGIRKKDLDNAPDFDSVQAEVSRIIKDRIVVGHSIHNDFSVLKLSHPPEKTRDTSHYYKTFFLGKTPSLKKLSETILGISIQHGEHDSVQDAQATMKLYVHVREKWNERVLKSADAHPAKHNVKTKKQKVKPKKKKTKAFYVMT